MGMFLIRLNKVVLLFKNCPSISLTLVLSNSNKGFLPHHTPRMRLLNVVFFFTGIPPRPLMMALGSKALFSATFFRPFFFFSLLLSFWFCLDVGLAIRSFFTPSDCSPCVKSGKGSTGSLVVGASVAVVSTVRLVMVGCWRVNVPSDGETSFLYLLPLTTTTVTIGSGGFAEFPPYDVRKSLGSPFRCFLLTGQRLFNAVSSRSTDSSQGGSFSRGNGGRYECQEWKESTSLTSFGFATDTTHGPSPSSTFGRHDVFETMKGTRYRHVHLGFFSICPRLAWPPPPLLAARGPAAAASGSGFWGPGEGKPLGWDGVVLFFSRLPSLQYSRPETVTFESIA